MAPPLPTHETWGKREGSIGVCKACSHILPEAAVKGKGGKNWGDKWWKESKTTTTPAAPPPKEGNGRRANRRSKEPRSGDKDEEKNTAAMPKQIHEMQQRLDKFEAETSAKPTSSDGGDADAEMHMIIQGKVKMLRLRKKQLDQTHDFVLDMVGGRKHQLDDSDKQLQSACAAQRESRPLREQKANIDNQLKNLIKQQDTAVAKFEKTSSQLEELKVLHNEQAAEAVAAKARADACKQKAALITERMTAEIREGR